jgi:hypothetical protein
VADAGEVILVAGEREEVGDGVLSDQQCEVPSFLARSDEEVPTHADHRDGSARGLEERPRVTDVAIVRSASGDRRWRSELREVAVVGGLAKAKQIEHHDRALDRTIDEGKDIGVRRVQEHDR